MLWCTGRDTELKNEFLHISILHCSKMSKIVFTLSQKLLKLGYVIGLDNYHGSPAPFDMFKGT